MAYRHGPPKTPFGDDPGCRKFYTIKGTLAECLKYNKKTVHW